MNSLVPVIVVFGTAYVVSAVGAGMDSAPVQYGAEVVAMLAVSAGVALTGRHRTLRLFGLLLAAAAAADLTGAWLPYPNPAPTAPGGCPRADEAVVEYWTSWLRLSQLAAALHFAALICVAKAVRELPRRAGLRPGTQLLLIGLVSIPAVLIGLYPVYSADNYVDLSSPGVDGEFVSWFSGVR